MVPCRVQAASSPRIITFSGQKITSIFEGLRPSHFAPEFRGKDRNGEGRRPWEERLRRDQPWEEGASGRRGARFVLAQCGQCNPNTPCIDHYVVITSCGASCCVNPVGCGVVSNFKIDTQHGFYHDGEQDTYCGLYCCVDSENCDN